MSDIFAKCEAIRKDYSSCDVSDALLKLGVPSAGYLRDISPLPVRFGRPSRIVAPVSTVVFVDKGHHPGLLVHGLKVPRESNLPKDRHFTDVASEGTIVLMQQPSAQIVALVGDIVATRYKIRGVKGVVIDGRIRDMSGCSKLCEDGRFTCFARSLSTVGTSFEAKPWAVDIPLHIGHVEVSPGDVLVADESEAGACVIPFDKMDEVLALLPVLKEADDGLLHDVQGGMDFKTSIARHARHYSNH